MQPHMDKRVLHGSTRIYGKTPQRFMQLCYRNFLPQFRISSLRTQSSSLRGFGIPISVLVAYMSMTKTVYHMSSTGRGAGLPRYLSGHIHLYFLTTEFTCQ